jgi:RND family efflux transporter MFP subunit
MRHAVLILSLLVLAACAARTVPPPPPPPVTVATPLPMKVVDWDDFEGQFQAIDSVDIRPRVTGYLQSVAFKDGEIVRKGQLLFEIDPRPYQAVLDQARGAQEHAQAAYANALADSVRGKTLLAAHAISEQAYDALVASERTALADLASTRAQVAAAALNVDFTRVTAPLAGRVSDRRIAPGNLVTADTTVLTNIVSLDPIRFLFSGSEALYLKYQRANAAGTRTSSRFVANPVEVRLQDETDYRWKGHMDFVDNALDPSSGTIRGRALIDNPGDFLTPGMFGHLRLLGSGAYDALMVPDAAVFTDQERQVVFVVGADGLARQRPVELGPLSRGLRVIRSGLAPADRVIIDGVQRAQAGHKVAARLGAIVAGPLAADADTAALAPIASTAQPVADGR